MITLAERRLLLQRLQVLQVQLLTKLYFREVFRQFIHRLQWFIHRLQAFIHTGSAAAA